MDPETKVALLDAAKYAVDGAESLVSGVSPEHAAAVWPAAIQLLTAATGIISIVMNSDPPSASASAAAAPRTNATATPAPRPTHR
jgi:hypothetical protein